MNAVAEEICPALAALTLRPMPMLEAELVALRPRRRLSVVEWAETRRELSAWTSAIPGRFNFEHTPHMVEPALTLSDPTVRQVTVMSCIRCGKTDALGLNFLGWVIEEDPGPFMQVMPTENDVIQRVTTRIRPMFEGCPSLMGHIAGDISRLNMGKESVLDNMFLFLAWSNSDAMLSDKNIRFLDIDEAKDYTHSAVDQAKKRTTTFWNRKILVTSSPRVEDDAIDTEFKLGDRRRYWIPCPHCGAWFVPTWRDNVLLDKGEGNHLLAPEAYDQGRVAFGCAACGAVWEESQRVDATLLGVYAPDGCEVARWDQCSIDIKTLRTDNCEIGGRLVSPGYSAMTLLRNARAGRDERPDNADAIIVGRMPVTSHHSYQVPSWILHWAGILNQCAQEFASAVAASKGGDVTQLALWTGDRDGRPWAEIVRATDEEGLAKHKGDYRLDELPPEVAFLTAGVDVQADRFYLAVWGWGFSYEAWLIRELEIQTGPTELFESFDPLKDALSYRWRRPGEGADGAAGVGIALAFIDARYQSDQVHDFVARFGGCPVLASGGEDNLGARMFRLTDVDESRRERGKKMHGPGGAKLWGLNTLLFKDRLARMSNITKPGPGYLHLPSDVSDEFLRQFSSEHKKLVGEGAHRRHRWVVKPGRDGNHYWDSSYYALAAAVHGGKAQSVRDPSLPTPPPIKRQVRISR